MIIFTLDALADDSHRRPLIDCKPFAPNWEAYNAACDGDKAIIPVQTLFESLWDKYEVPIQIWTDRNESLRPATSFWLMENSLPVGSLIKMRPIGDDSPQEVLFERWLMDGCKIDINHRPPGVKYVSPIEMVFSSHKPTIEMFRRRNVFVFDCNQE